jgi:hypothetical protein
MNRYRSNAIRTLTAKFAGTCACCGGDIPAGKFIEYNPRTKQIAHFKAWEGNSPECYGVLKAKQDPGFVDLDRAYEDRCADICGR